MWRALFIALGLSTVLLGVECLLIDKAYLVNRGGSGDPNLPAVATVKEVAPAEWMPWSLMSVGAVVMLYTITVPKKLKE